MKIDLSEVLTKTQDMLAAILDLAETRKDDLNAVGPTTANYGYLRGALDAFKIVQHQEKKWLALFDADIERLEKEVLTANENPTNEKSIKESKDAVHGK